MRIYLTCCFFTFKPAFSLYGFLWFTLSDFLPRGLSSFGLALAMQTKPVKLTNFGSSKRVNDKKNTGNIEFDGNELTVQVLAPPAPGAMSSHSHSSRSKPSGGDSSIITADYYEAPDRDFAPMKTFRDISSNSDLYNNSEDSVNNPVH